MGLVKAITYNCQTASWPSRMSRTFAIFSFLQFIGLQGTRTRRKLLQNEDDTFCVQRYKHFDAVHWFAAEGAFTNSSTGVTVAVDKRYFHVSHRAQIFSPPSSLQGRGGAVLYQKRHLAYLFASLYFFTASVFLAVPVSF